MYDNRLEITSPGKLPIGQTTPRLTPTTKNDIGGVKNGVSNAGNGVNRNESGTNGGKVPLNKEQIQLENLLQIIEKSPYKWTFE